MLIPNRLQNIQTKIRLGLNILLNGRRALFSHEDGPEEFRDDHEEEGSDLGVDHSPKSLASDSKAPNEPIGSEAARQSLKENSNKFSDSFSVPEKIPSNRTSQSFAKSQFVANISHEMRTPLGVVMGFTDLAIGLAEKNSEQMNYLKRVKRSSEVLFDLINDILDLSRIEAQNILIERQKVDLPKLLRELVEDMSLFAREKDVQIEMNLASELPQFVLTDAIRLQQILQNLLKHAVKFTERGRVAVQIESSSTLQGVKLKFRIQDIGKGASPEYQSKLFQDFSPLELSASTPFCGSGLGLALAKGLSQVLGGDLIVENSGAGNANVFLLTLHMDLAAPHHSSLDEPQALQGASILLVEDSLDNQILIGRFLRSAGAKVDSAINGQVALEKVMVNRYDLVVMDLQMPVLDGAQAAQAMRLKGLQIPIVALTAHALKSEREMALQSGFSDFLTKPIGRDHLISSLAKCLLVPESCHENGEAFKQPV